MSKQNTENKQPKKYPPNYYNNPDEFRDEILLSQKLGKVTPRCSELFVELIDHVAKSKSFTFSSPQHREDVTGWAYTVVFVKYDKFDMSVTDNAFSYYTSIARNAIIEGFRKATDVTKGVKSVTKIPIDTFINYNNNND